MTGDPDRIAVPTNGRKPHPVEPLEPLEPLRGEPPTAAPPTGEPAPNQPARTRAPRIFDPTDPALLGAVSPRGLAVGFGIVASLVLLAVGRSRLRRGR
jgi:hypothetical protein